MLLYDAQTKAKHKTLKANFKGRYKIMQVHDNQNATLQISPTKLRTYHSNLLKPGNSQDDGYRNLSYVPNYPFDHVSSTPGLQSKSH